MPKNKGYKVKIGDKTITVGGGAGVPKTDPGSFDDDAVRRRENRLDRLARELEEAGQTETEKEIFE